MNHKQTFLITEAERNFLRTLHGGCQIPVGVTTRIEKGQFSIEGAVFSVDGKKEIRNKLSGSVQKAKEIAISLAKTISEAGGHEILEEIRKTLNEK